MRTTFRGSVFLSSYSGARQQVRYMNFHLGPHPQQRASVFFVQGDITYCPSVNQPALRISSVRPYFPDFSVYPIVALAVQGGALGAVGQKQVLG